MLALAFTTYTFFSLKSEPTGKDVGRPLVDKYGAMIKDGAMAFLKEEYKWLSVFVRISVSRRVEAPSRHRCDSWPSHEVVAGFFFEFEPFRTASSDRDAPRRSCCSEASSALYLVSRTSTRSSTAS